MMEHLHLEGKLPTLSLKHLALLLIAGLFAPCIAAQTELDLPPETQLHVQHVQNGLLPAVVLKDDPHATHSLAERMAAMHVPGVSIAVIHKGTIDWAQGFGEATIGGPPVTIQTIFQAGSISKPLAAMGVLKLVQQKRLSMNVDVNSMLKSWKIPDAPVAEGKALTLRELLTHTGGTTVHGFPGYAAGEPVPTLIQVLNGEKPANTPAIRFETAPGTKWNYSGGGYTILQQIVLDTTHEPFPKFMRDTVLIPMAMTSSTYEQPLPTERRALAATPYDSEGKPIPGGAHTYPEMAAAGLWTMPTDLARYVTSVQESLRGESNPVLSQATTKDMLTAGMGNWGLGLQIGGSPSNPYFSHGGVNEGFESLFVGYEQGGEGAVVMTNAQGGSVLAEEVMRSIAAEYNWPDFRPVVKTAVAVDPKVLADYVGTFDVAHRFDVTFTVEDGHLMGETAGQGKLRLYAESATRFFPLETDLAVEFVRDDQGKVTQMILHHGGQDLKAVRK